MNVSIAITRRFSKAPDAKAFARVLKRWAVRYRSFIQERFDTYSKGGGTWPPLARSTIARRRRGRGKKRKVSILRDTGTLFQALSPTMKAVGSLETIDSFEKNVYTLEVGFGGPSKHPSGAATIADIARFHHYGMGVPVRTILVNPDAALVQHMQDDLLSMLNG